MLADISVIPGRWVVSFRGSKWWKSILDGIATIGLSLLLSPRTGHMSHMRQSIAKKQHWLNDQKLNSFPDTPHMYGWISSIISSCQRNSTKKAKPMAAALQGGKKQLLVHISSSNHGHRGRSGDLSPTGAGSAEKPPAEHPVVCLGIGGYTKALPIIWRWKVHDRLIDQWIQAFSTCFSLGGGHCATWPCIQLMMINRDR